jgi:hypothetical protein
MSETNRLPLSHPAHPAWASLSHHPKTTACILLLFAGVVAIAHVLFW